MKRKCTKYPIDDFLKEFGKSSQNLSIYIDNENIDDIKKFLKKGKKKFRRIVYDISKGYYTDGLYGKEGDSPKTKNITAMKFKGKNFNNARIYCKEFFQSGKKVVMIVLLNKKVQKNKDDPNIKKRLEIIGGYEYEFEE